MRARQAWAHELARSSACARARDKAAFTSRRRGVNLAAEIPHASPVRLSRGMLLCWHVRISRARLVASGKLLFPWKPRMYALQFASLCAGDEVIDVSDRENRRNAGSGWPGRHFCKSLIRDCIPAISGAARSCETTLKSRGTGALSRLCIVFARVLTAVRDAYC